MLIILLLLVIVPTPPAQSQKKKADSVENHGKMTPNIVEKLVNENDSLRRLLGIKDTTTNANAKDSVINVLNTKSYILHQSNMLAICILIFALLLIGGIMIFLYSMHKSFGPYAFQTIGLVIVVSSALFLIVTGYDKDQITPVIGLLGTIVGFVFGSNLNNKTGNTQGPKKESSDDAKTIEKTS